MTWVAWRVQRLQFVTAAGVVVVLVLWLAPSGLDGDAGWSQYWNNADVYVLYALPGRARVGDRRLAHRLREMEPQEPRIDSPGPRASHGPTSSASKLLRRCHGERWCCAVLIPLLDWWTGAMRSGPAAVSNIVPKLFGITGFVAVGYVLFAFLLGIALRNRDRTPRMGICRGTPYLWRRPAAGRWPTTDARVSGVCGQSSPTV